MAGGARTAARGAALGCAAVLAGLLAAGCGARPATSGAGGVGVTASTSTSPAIGDATSAELTRTAAGSASTTTTSAGVPASTTRHVNAGGTTTVDLGIKVVVSQADAGRTVSLHPGEGIEVEVTGPYVVHVDAPDILANFEIPTPTGQQFFHALRPGRGTVVVHGTCAAPSREPTQIDYTVTVDVSG